MNPTIRHHALAFLHDLRAVCAKHMAFINSDAELELSIPGHGIVAFTRFGANCSSASCRFGPEHIQDIEPELCGRR